MWGMQASPYLFVVSQHSTYPTEVGGVGRGYGTCYTAEYFPKTECENYADPPPPNRRQA